MITPLKQYDPAEQFINRDLLGRQKTPDYISVLVEKINEVIDELNKRDGASVTTSTE